MKFAIGIRLFIAVLLSIFGVAVLALALMTEKVEESFSDYAIQIELNRLQEMAESLQMRYAEKQDWSFLPIDAQEKRDWISDELLRLYEKKNDVGADSQLVSKVIGSTLHAPVAPQAQVGKSIVDAADILLPAIPPLPPDPPVPPRLPAIPEPLIHVSEASAENSEHRHAGVARLSLPSLYRRITLLDQEQHYLAGRVLDKTSSARRSIYFGDQLIGFLQVTKSGQPTDAMAKDFLQKQTDFILTIVALSVLLSAAAASLLAMHFRRPILRLLEGSRLLANGNFATRLSEARSDELGELAHSFNQLADKLERTEQTRRQWVADTSHELRTPISVLRAQLEAMQDGIRQVSPENIALMLRQILSLNKLIDELYALARADVGDYQYHMQNLNVWDLVLEEVDNFKEKLATKQLSLCIGETTFKGNVRGDSDRLRQIFINLLENSLRYTTSGGCIKLSIVKQKDSVVLSFDDSAPGVPDNALARLGERFYRVDPSRNRQDGGAGLGLAMCGRIMEAHQGKIVFLHAPTGGLRVQLFFPLG